MEHAHLTPAGLRAHLEGDAGPEDHRLLLHLIAVCPACREVGGYLLELHGAGAIDDDFCSLDVDLAHSRRRAAGLLAALRAEAPPRQAELARDDPRFASLGLCERLCEESLCAAADDPLEAERLAGLAMAVAERLPAGCDVPDVQSEWLFELRGYALAHFANAMRVQGRLTQAEIAFGRADDLWRKGWVDVGDVLDYEARYLGLRASLLRAQRRLTEALTLLEQALGAESTQRERPYLLINKAKTLEELGDTTAAIGLLEQALRDLDPLQEPRLWFCVHHNLLDALSKAGRFEEAEVLLSEVRSLSTSHAGSLDRARLDWVEGRLAAEAGRLGEAVNLLELVRHTFITQGIGYDTALVTLELATLHARAGEPERVKALAREMLPLFESQAIHREAVAAITVFLKAAEGEQATAELTAAVADYLQRAWHEPSLRFDYRSSASG